MFEKAPSEPLRLSKNRKNFDLKILHIAKSFLYFWISGNICLDTKPRPSKLYFMEDPDLYQIPCRQFICPPSKEEPLKINDFLLVKVLAGNFWKIDPQWISAKTDYENDIEGHTAAVIIGDRTFELENKYPYSYDLAEEWQKFTQLPFVFACWVANKKLPDHFISEFNQALKFGIDNRTKLIAELVEQNIYSTDIGAYLTINIKYDYDSLKEKALNLFLDYISKMKL